jgi:hypothetical protein
VVEAFSYTVCATWTPNAHQDSSQAAGLPQAYDIEHPLNPWIMAAGTAIEHLMVHFSEEDAAAMMNTGN